MPLGKNGKMDVSTTVNVLMAQQDNTDALKSM